MKYLNLYKCCNITHGSSNTLLIDKERELYFTISNEYIDILNDFMFKGFTDEEISNLANNEYEFLIFLTENKFFYFSDTKISHNNKLINSSFDVESLIVDIKDIKDIYKWIDKFDLEIEYIQIRFFTECTPINISEIVDYVRSKINITTIELILNMNEQSILDDYIDIYKKNRIISRIVIMNYKENISLFDCGIITNMKRLVNKMNCGIINENLFTVDLNNVNRAMYKNSCLYKKIGIDTEGNIRNCPSMPSAFGNINSTILSEVIKHPYFEKYWNLTKDYIDVCKDCEFRYICTDCRAYTDRTHFTKDGLDISKPLKCGYNPYTGEWEEWSTSPLKQKAIKYYEIKSVTIDNDN